MKEELRRRALGLGFDACRFTGPEAPASADRFLAALAEGRHAGMEWMARNADRRVDPAKVLPGIRSVVVLAASYHGPEPSSDMRRTGTVARYARHADYHDVLAGPLRTLSAEVDALGGPGTRSLWYVDTGPILERDLAQRAGLGFVGRHTNLVSRGLGNWFLLAEILTTADLEPDPPEHNRCGSCTRCLQACPTGALPAPFTLDARRCVSYLTIELKGAIPEELRPLVGDRIYGCDDCLAACPWNRFAREGALLRSHRREALARPSLHALLELDAAGFKSMFAGTPMLRTKRRGLLRNVCVALGNTGSPDDLPVLERAAADPEPLVAEHAAWAIREIRRRHAVPDAA